MELDWIELDDFRIHCIIGVLEREQREAQHIEIVIRMGLDLSPAAGGDLTRSVNYAEVADQAEFIAKNGSWRLLESLGTAISQLVLSDPAPAESRAIVERIEVLMRKPEILGDQATPAVRLHRSRDFRFVRSSSIAKGIEVEVLAQTNRRGAYRVHLAPGRGWSLPDGMGVFVIAGECRVGTSSFFAGNSLSRAHTSEIRNTGEGISTLLLVGPSLDLP